MFTPGERPPLLLERLREWAGRGRGGSGDLAPRLPATASMIGRNRKRPRLRFRAISGVAVSCMLTCTAAHGQDIFYAGPLDCGKWVEARKVGRAGIFEGYLIGLLNGLALGRDVEFWRAGGDRISQEQAQVWMDKYCAENPLNEVMDGAYALIDERTNGAFSAAGR